jgi:hypothetical protein
LQGTSQPPAEKSIVPISSFKRKVMHMRRVCAPAEKEELPADQTELPPSKKEAASYSYLKRACVRKF